MANTQITTHFLEAVEDNNNLKRLVSVYDDGVEPTTLSKTTKYLDLDTGLGEDADYDAIINLAKDQIHSSVIAWVTSTAYVTDDERKESGKYYICLSDHTSATFSDDLTANKWKLIEGRIIYVKLLKSDSVLSICYRNRHGEKQSPIHVLKSDMSASNPNDQLTYDDGEALGLTYMPA